MRLFLSIILFSIALAQNPMSIEPGFIDFGLVAIGETATAEAVISNSSNELLTVQISTNIGYIYSTYPSINVPSNGSASVELNYSPSSAGQTDAIISFTSNYNGVDYTSSINCTGSSFSVVAGGEVSGVWDTSVSPIIVENNITIPVDETLTIEPGVIIYFEFLTSLVVEGTLNAIGNYEDKITFTSLNEDEYWNGISYINSNENDFEYVIIEGVIGNSFMGSNLMDPAYWSCGANWSGNSFYATNDGSGQSEVTCSLKYPIINNADSINVTFSGGLGSGAFGNGDVEVTLYSDQNSYQLINCGSGCSQSVDIYLSDYFDMGEKVYVSVYLRDGASSNGTYAPEPWFHNLFVDVPIKSAIYLKNSDLQISNSLLINNVVAVKSDSSSLNILNCNYIDNTIINILNKFSTIDLKNSIIYGSPLRGSIDTYADGILLQSYTQIDQFPYFLDDEYHLDVDLSPAVDAGDPILSDECIPPGLNGIRSDIGMYGGPNNCGSLESNVPDGKPIIDAIVDIPYDQGGYVGIQYQASGYENDLPIHDIERYSFWRALNTEGREGVDASTSPDSEIWDTRDGEYWEYIGEMVAQGFDLYGYTAPTIADSSSSGDFISTFLVIAHIDDEDIYFVSEPASGHSIDNLAPPTPQQFSAFHEDDEISMHWEYEYLEDFSHHSLNSLYSDEINILDTFIVTSLNVEHEEYRVFSEDYNGNASDASKSTFALNLHSGANLKSFNVLPEDNSITNVLSSLGDNVTGIITEGGAATQIAPGTWVGSLTYIDDTKGYWVIMDVEDILLIIGTPIDRNISYELHAGANLIGYPYRYETSISEALPNDIEDSITGIITEGGATTQIASGSWVGSLTALEGSNGYWMILDEDIILTFENGCDEQECAMLSRKSNLVADLPDEYKYAQSSKQAFYFFQYIAGISKGDYILAYNGDEIIGTRQWQGRIIDVPAMGSDGNDYSAEYIEAGSTPTFKLLSGDKLISLEGDIPAWSDNGLFIVSSLSQVVIPENYSLSQAYPNPFNPTTTLSFAIPIDSEVSLSVYNLQGREVSTLIDANMDAGYHSIVWDANSYASGVYFVKMMAGEYVHTQKLMLVK